MKHTQHEFGLDPLLQSWRDRGAKSLFALLQNQLNEHEASRDSVDAMCESFASSQTWPVPTQAHHELLFFYRMQFAQRFVGLLSGTASKIVGEPFHEATEAQLLRLILVDFWHEFGEGRYILERYRHVIVQHPS